MMRILPILMFIVVVSFSACEEDQTMPMPGGEETISNPESYFVGTIGGVTIDSMKYDCDIYRGQILNLYGASTSSVAGFRIYILEDYWELSENLNVRSHFYIHDSVDFTSVLSPEVVIDYLENKPENLYVKLDVSKDGISYSNCGLTDTTGDGPWNIDYIAIDQTIEIDYDKVYSDEESCFGGGDTLPIIIRYSGVLRSEDLNEELEIANLSLQTLLLVR